jgi:hypothetical protein
MKLRLSILRMKSMTSPPSAQAPKQYQYPREGVTWKLGVFSSWNGQRPFMVPPTLRRVT